MKFFLICILLASVAHGAPANNDLYQFKELLKSIEHELAAPKHVAAHAPKHVKTYSPIIKNLDAPRALIPGSPLGNGLKIRKFDLLGEELYGGYPFFADFKNCNKTKPAQTRHTLDTFSSSTQELFQHVSTSTSVSASLQNAFTMGATFSATTGYSNSEKINIKGITLKIVNPNGGEYISAECLYKLDVNAVVEQEFKRLPVKINNPSDPTSWLQYERFLHYFGSHVITDVTYGSSVHQNTYAKSTSSYSQRMFTIRACLDLVGPTNAGKVNASACSALSKTDIEKAESMDTTKSLYARGGTEEQRAKIQAHHTLADIDQFLKDAAHSKAGIDYKMEPIWKLLMYKFGVQNDQDRARAMNLEAYYKGFLSFECKFERDNDIVLQKFALIEDSTPTEPKYHCILQPEGCHSDDDCHYQHVGWCSCNGDSCVHYDTQDLASGQTKTTAYINYEIWGWHGCDKPWFGATSCYCYNDNKKWKEVWSLARGPSVAEEVYEEIAFKKQKEIEKNDQEIKMIAQAIKDVINEDKNINYY
jgi:hypothetical protein